MAHNEPGGQDINGSQGKGRKTKKKKKWTVRRIASDVIILCLFGVMLISGWRVITIMHDYNKNQNIYDTITEKAQPDWYSGTVDFDALREVNPDIVGWLYYKDTKIDYPVVKGADNEKYLHTMFDGTYSGFGTLFVDAVTEAPFRQFNTIIYGHHMLNGSMFGDIKELKNQDYADKHPQFELLTPEGNYHLVICAFLNQPSDSSIYYTNFNDEDNIRTYIDGVKATALYLTDEEMTPDANYVILSTCAYEYQEARYMVVTKMIPW